MAFPRRLVTAKLGAVLLLISLIAASIGIISPSWSKFDNINLGIWWTCFGNNNEFRNCHLTIALHRTDLFTAAMSFVTIGVVFLFISTCAAFCATSRVVGAVLGILGGLMIFISVVLYYVNVSSKPENEILDWGFFLSGMSGGLGFIGGLLSIPGQYQKV